MSDWSTRGGPQVMGHVLLSATRLDAPRRIVDVLSLSPLGEVPEIQCRGIGTRLIAYALAAAAVWAVYADTVAGRRRDNAMDSDIRTRAALEEHWRASERGDTEAEHAIYAADAILDYPQSGERFRGRETISAQRGGHPASRHFTVHRIVGGGDLWVSECVITYDGCPATR
ncbi:nuclear transport factor 2 family protein [Streptomyces scopuliridis]|uniref:nuclear transport factor 2 family protein n=1 Tax=Streptomyces scopuliridis TaxID=452529 RepID=UPI00369F5812